MQWLASISVKRPVFATVIILSLTVIGAFSFGRLGLDRFPKVDFPTVVVTTRLPGAAPEEVETEITDKIEEAVNTISGIDELRSSSSEGVSQVIIAFLLEKNADIAAQEVRDRVNRVLPLLPRTIEQPTVEKFDPDSAPVLTLSVSANKPMRDITEYADKKLRRQLENVSGVGQVVVSGGRSRQINIWLDPARLHAYNLTVTDVSRALQTQNAEIPGGRIEQGATSLTLRTRGRVQSVEEFGNIVVKERGGHAILLRDVARVEDGMAESLTRANMNGEPTVLLTVRRQSGTNTVQVVDAVKERLEDIASTVPPGYDIHVVRDMSEFIKASIKSVEEHLIVGSILAAAVVLVFLWNWRSTFIAAIAIPTSIIATFGLIWFQGFTLNSMTMLALTLAVGIVIDDAIVVLENIYRFVEEKGRPPMQAAIEATREIGLAVLATTLSLVAIFVPVGFMGGIVGRFMTSFGFTMAFAILVSLLVSFTLTPMLSARWIKMRPRREDAEGHEIEEASTKDSRFFKPIDRAYTSMLKWSLAHRWAIAALAVLVLLSSVPLFQIVDKNFLPNDDQSEFEVGIRAPEGTAIDATEIIANRIATRIRQLPEVEFALVTVADDPARTQNVATVYTRLKPVDQRDRDQFEVMNDVRANILPKVTVANLRTGVRPVAAIGGGGNQNAEIQFTINGPDLKKLETFAAAIADAARKEHGVVDVDTSMNVGKPELSVLRRPDEGCGPRRQGVGRGRSAAVARRRRPGDDLQRGRRAVRGARSRRAGCARHRGRDRPADRSVREGRQRAARQPGAHGVGNVTVGDQPAEPSAPGDDLRRPPAWSLTDRSDGFDDQDRRLSQHGTGIQHAVRGQIAGARARGAELPDRLRALAGVHVSDPRGAVRVVAASGDDPAVTAADVAVRAALDHHHGTVAEHLLGAGPARAVRGGEEELHPADRPRQSAEGSGHGARRGHPPGQPRSFEANSHDYVRIRRRNDSARAVERHRFGHQPRDRVRHHRRPVAGAGPDAGRDAGRLLALRRGGEPQAVALAPRGADRGGDRGDGPRPADPAGGLAGAQPVTTTLPREQPPASAETLRLTRDEAVRMAMENNPELAVVRYEPGASDARVAAAYAAFLPTFTSGVNRNSAATPPVNLFSGEAGIQTDYWSADAGLVQRLKWGGASYNVSFVSQRTTTDNPFTSFTPSLTSALQAIFSQPLLRDFKTDSARAQVEIENRNRDIADIQVRERVAQVAANAEAGYWALVAALASVDVQQRSLELAQELERNNRARVDVGQSPPLDLVAARAEVAQRQENLIIARTTALQAEDLLRTLIVDPKRTDYWSVRIDPAERQPAVTGAPNVDEAVRRALAERSDIAQARKQIENSDTNVALAKNQTLPDLRAQATYLTNGQGGSRLIREGGFPGAIVGLQNTSYGSVLGQVLGADYPTWTVGFSLSYPLGHSASDANLARARIEREQSMASVRSLELSVVREVRDAALRLEQNRQRIETAKVGRELAEQRLDAEQRRFEVGMSTSFLVIQAQRDLAIARDNELRSYLDYQLAAVTFERVQKVGTALGAGTAALR